MTIEPGAPLAEGTKPPRVLVIEDDADTASLIVEALHDHFKARCVEHVSRLAALAGSDLRVYDIILCDFNLPDGNGIDALRFLKQRQPNTPVIMVTGQSQPQSAVTAIRSGAADYVVKTPEFLSTLPLVVEKNLAMARMQRENRRLQDALNESFSELRQKNRELEEAVAKLEELALTDSLTGLSNRRHLEWRLTQMHAEALRYGADLACLMIDLDGFKQINDTLGHQRGDELLELTGRVIGQQIRSSDAAARFGGDEFVVLLPHTTCATAATLAQRLSATFHRDAARLYGGVRCSMSIGIACVNLSHPTSSEQLLSHADNALYAAKQAGKQRIMVCARDGVTSVDAEVVIRGERTPPGAPSR